MNAPARTFHFAPAVRDRVSLLIALAGASGGGKTLSALKVARGLAGGDDSKVAVVDTEAGRAKHYAVAPGEQPGPDRFAFQHGDLHPPFSPDAYAEAIAAADAAGFEVIMIDSCSHEWEGEGGLHDMQMVNVEDAIEKARKSHKEQWGPFDEAKAAERASIGAWKVPKRLHKRFVGRLLQCRAHLILCLRAEEKLRIEQIEDERGRKRTVIVQPKDMPPKERWVPICEKRFMYEMTLSLILTPQDPGIPIEIKLQAQHRAAVPLDQHLSEETGRRLAEWARGGSATISSRPASGEMMPEPAPGEDRESAPQGAGSQVPIPGGLEVHDAALAMSAKAGFEALKLQWSGIDPEDQKRLRERMNKVHAKTARAADKERGQ